MWRTVSLIVAFGFAFSANSSELKTVPASDLEPELRCCFHPEELVGAFMIRLINKDNPVAQLSLHTPEGTRVGYDAATRGFYRPTKEAIYAGELSASVDSIETEDSHGHRDQILLLHSLHAGEYRVKVISIRRGRYYLGFYPAGYPDSSGSQSFGYPDGIAIDRGEIHVYTFNGKFDDPKNGSISPASPTYFRVKRVN